jgi:uncharacterized protein YkwD
MTSITKWVLGLVIVLAILLQQPLAWGQLRTRSGAAKSSVEHPKDLEQRVFQFTNEARRKNGLAPLEPDKTLMTIARQKSDDMIKRHYFSHPDPNGKTIKEKYAEAKPTAGGMVGVGENISIQGRNTNNDTTTTARCIVDGFMVSPGHRQNILQPQYTHLGIGISVTDKEYYVTQGFGVSSNRKP